MVTDTFPALALAMEPGDPDVMRRPPRDPEEAILSRGFLISVLAYGLLITASTLAAFVWALDHAAERASTMAFMTLALAQSVTSATHAARDAAAGTRNRESLCARRCGGLCGLAACRRDRGAVSPNPSRRATTVDRLARRHAPRVGTCDQRAGAQTATGFTLPTEVRSKPRSSPAGSRWPRAREREPGHVPVQAKLRTSGHRGLVASRQSAIDRPLPRTGKSHIRRASSSATRVRERADGRPKTHRPPSRCPARSVRLPHRSAPSGTSTGLAERCVRSWRPSPQ
jgi:hypothetical protein